MSGIYWHIALRCMPRWNVGMEEQVALFNEHGQVVGQAPRSEVRAENLRHGATSIVVFNADGHIFVHQRTPIKDVYPGLYDFTAGGVIQVDEHPDESARREAKEELGVHSKLVALGEANYCDASTTYRAFLYWTIVQGPLRLQAEEVACGSWVAQNELIADITRDPTRYMPDSVELLLDWLRGLNGNLPVAH